MDEIEHEIEHESEHDAIFDGELLKRRLGRFLERLNTALAEAQDHLPDLEIDSILVNTVVGINGNISFPSGAGIGLEHSRSIQFILKPKTKNK